MFDNTTAVAYIREMGGSKSKQCNEIAWDVWQFAKQTNLWLSSAYIKGELNVISDQKSHKFDRELEWKLSQNIFHKALSMLNVNCNIDLFASRLNYQLRPFVSYKPDSETMSVDAFTINWKSWHFYAFPPFALITRVLQKICTCVDEATGVIIVPFWSTQAFFPTHTNMFVSSTYR